MNTTEEKALSWLNSKGITATFQRRTSPDFICESGEGFEVKFLRNNAITFSNSQFDKLIDFPSKLTIIVFNGGGEPLAKIPFTEIAFKPDYWKNIRIVRYNALRRDESKTIVNISKEDKESLRVQAKKLGLTLAGYIRMILIKSLS